MALQPWEMDWGQEKERPLVENEDDTYSSELSITVEDPRINDGMPTNIPSMYGGKELSQEEAIAIVADAGGVDPETGRELKGFGSIDEAVQSAKSRSESLQTPLKPWEMAWAEPAKPKPESTASGRIGDMGVDVVKGAVGLGQSVVGLAGFATLGGVSEGMRSLGYEPDKTRDFLSSLYSDARKFEEEELKQAKGFKGTVGALATTPGVLAGKVIETAPQMLTLIASARYFSAKAGVAAYEGAIASGATKVAAKAIQAKAAAKAGTIAASVGEGMQQTGSSFDDYMAKGVDIGKAYVASAGSGITTAATALVGGRIGQKLGLGDVEAGITGKGRLPVRMAGGAVQEGTLEELPQSATEQMWSNFAFDKPLMEGVPEAAGTGLVVGAAAGGAMAAGIRPAPVGEKQPWEENWEGVPATQVQGAPEGEFADRGVPLDMEAPQRERADVLKQAEIEQAYAEREAAEVPDVKPPLDELTEYRIKQVEEPETAMGKAFADIGRREEVKFEEGVEKVLEKAGKPQREAGRKAQERLKKLETEDVSKRVTLRTIDRDRRLRELREKTKDIVQPEGLVDPRIKRVPIREKLEEMTVLKFKESTDEVDAEVDEIMEAVAKLGGINSESAKSEGIDPEHFRDKVGKKNPFRKEGDSLDGMAEKLSQYGYLPEKYSGNDLLILVDKSLGGDPVHSTQYDPGLEAGKALARDGLQPGKVQNVIRRALIGKTLGVRQARIVQSLMDEVSTERVERKGDLKEAHDMLRRAIRGFAPLEAYQADYEQFGQKYEESEYDLEATAAARGMHELAEEASDVDLEATDNILERFKFAKDSTVARKLLEVVESGKETRKASDIRAEEVEGKPREEPEAEAEEAPEVTETVEGQKDMLGRDETAQAIQDKKEARKKKEREAPPMEKGPGDLFTEKAKQVDIEDAAAEAALSPENNIPEPTEAMKHAGNYKVGKITLHGIPISIENPKGSVRSGTDSDGETWQTTMKSHYGYIRENGEGADGDHPDVFLTDNAADETLPVFIIDQVDPNTRRFDEHKIVMGAKGEAEARKKYLENYAKNWDGIGEIKEFTIDEFKEWLAGDTTKRVTKPERARPTEKKAVLEITKPVKAEKPPVSDITPEKPAEQYADLDGKKISYEVKVEDTGEVMTVTQDAGKVMRAMDRRIDSMNALLDCLK